MNVHKKKCGQISADPCNTIGQDSADLFLQLCRDSVESPCAQALCHESPMYRSAKCRPRILQILADFDVILVGRYMEFHVHTERFTGQPVTAYWNSPETPEGPLPTTPNYRTRRNGIYTSGRCILCGVDYYCIRARADIPRSNP